MSGHTRAPRPWLVGLVLMLIVAGGGWLRYIAVYETSVIIPLRADASQYYSYAANMKLHGVYSNVRPKGPLAEQVAPPPDADRMPGYALFLLDKVQYPPSQEMLNAILDEQALIDTITVVVVFLLALCVMPATLALVPALLTALSPHLVSMTTYVLTETLFTFVLTLSVLLGAWAVRKPQAMLRWLAFGVALASTYLVKSSMVAVLLFALPAVWLVCADKTIARRAMLAVVVGFVVLIAPWQVRNTLNLPADAPTQGGHAIVSVLNGTYPGLMVNDDPRTRGFPHRADPQHASYDSYPKVFGKVWREFRAQPLKITHWYAIGKPTMFFSWSMVSGMGDVFVYPVQTSPFFTRNVFQRVHLVMAIGHWPITLVALAMVVVCWLPVGARVLGSNAAAALRLASVPLLYLLALHVVTTPLPRYGIPLRPLIHLFFAAAVCWLWLLLRSPDIGRNSGRDRGRAKLYAGWDPIGTVLSNWRVAAVRKALPAGVHVDLACGDNRLVRALGRGYGIDISNFAGVDVQVKHFSTLPLADASVDSASILAALNYFEAPEKTLQELHRALKPGGVVVITLLAKSVSHYWHKLRDRGLPRITFDEDELRAIVAQTDLRWRSQSRFMFGLNRLIVLEKPQNP